MIGLENHEFLIGVAAGKILLGALLASSVFRNVALAVGASAICFTYFQKGIIGFLGATNSILTDFAMRPSFSKGIALGAVLAMVVFGMYQKRKLS